MAGELVCLTFADNGHGMPPDVVERAFEPFYTTADVGQGTGLGLSMVYGVIRQLGGTVTIESAVGAGTSVSLFMPIAPDIGTD